MPWLIEKLTGIVLTKSFGFMSQYYPCEVLFGILSVFFFAIIGAQKVELFCSNVQFKSWKFLNSIGS